MKTNPNHDLLVTGARDFLQASAAIAKFGDEIYGAALRVLKRRAAELDAAGIPLNVNKVKPHPKEGYVGSEYDGTEAVIGAYVTVPKGYFYVYVYWRLSDKGDAELCSAIASVECYSVGAAESLYRSFHESKAAFKVDRYEVYAEKLLDPEDFVTLESHFDTLIEQWIAHTKVIGGLKKYLK